MSVVETARSAPEQGRAPYLPAGALSTLADLFDALESEVRGRIIFALRQCADSVHAWTALRIAEWIVSSSSAPDGGTADEANRS